MKTAIMYEVRGYETKFFVVDGDFSRFDGVILHCDQDEEYYDEIKALDEGLLKDELSFSDMIDEVHGEAVVASAHITLIA